MNNIFIRNIPSIQEREFKYRGKMESHELNALQKEAFDDVLDLFNKANQLQKNVYEMRVAHGIEMTCYSKRLEESLAQIQILQERLNNAALSSNDFRYLTCYSHFADIVTDSYSAVKSTETNDITAHINNSTSKTRLYDETYDEILIPPSLQVYIGPDSFRPNVGDIGNIEDSDVKNIFDGNDNTVWFRKIYTSINVTEIENEVIIGLPEDIITSRLTNEIVIKPFPTGYVDVVDVQYRSNGSWQTIPGFTSHSGYHSDVNQGINNAGNLKFNFPAIQTNQIKIKLRQRNYEDDLIQNRRIWYLGLRDVDVLYNIYTRDHSVFEMVFNFTEENRTIEIYDTEVLFNNQFDSGDTNFGITKEYFYFDDAGNTHKIDHTVPFVLNEAGGLTNKMMVRFTIEGNQNTPNIHGCRVKYKIKSMTDS